MVDESVTDAIREGELEHTRAERDAFRDLACARHAILSAWHEGREAPDWALDMARKSDDDLEHTVSLKYTRAERDAWRNLATARASILSAYRTHLPPPGWALDMAHRARTELERMGTFHE